MTSSAGDQDWERLSAPAKAALRWAWAAALAGSTAVDATPFGVEVGSSELLVGILLADPVDGPALRLLEHFMVPPGEVLNHAGRPLTAPALLRAFDQLPEPVAVPPLGGQERVVLAQLLRETGPVAQVSLPALFGAVLHRSEAGRAIRAALVGRQVDADAVLRSYDEYLVQRQPYREFLRERFPYRPPVARLPGYLADQPDHADDPTGQDGPAGTALPDLVGIGAEVDAFARLIASTRLVPPLAVGLFGDWGSGKSYFMRSLRRRIDQVATGATGPFHDSIVQVEFNAWQYVDGDLWASLVEHLFRNLRVSGDTTDDLLAERQRYWVRQVQGAEQEHQAASETVAVLDQEHRDAAAAVAERERERDAAVVALEQARDRRPLAGWRPGAALSAAVRDAAAVAGLGETLGTALDDAGRLGEELERTRADLRGASAVLLPLRAGSWRYRAAVAGLVLLTPLVLLGLYALGAVAPVAAVAAVVAGALSTVAGYLALAAGAVRAVTGRVATAQAELARAEQQRHDELADEVAAAQEAVRTVQAQLDAAQAAERELAARVAAAEEALQAATPGQVLTEFITDRLDSDDYRRHLGVPALVRRDLQRLSGLVAAHQRDPDAGTVPGQYAIDRIVLYIDDLDRCPTPVVVRVLEAVHLLLAFPLFVVVVAVDARWLESSLSEHYRQLGGRGPSAEDYLEKIFQVPFRVRPLAPPVRQQLLRGLLTPSLAEFAGSGEAGDGPAGTDAHPTDLLAFRQLVDSLRHDQDRQGWVDAVALTVDLDELGLLEDAAELLGATPRAIKRFVNIYLLLKAMGIGRGWTLPQDGAVVVLLAVVNGLPRLASDLLAALADPVAGRLGDWEPSAGAADEHAVFLRWLDARPRWKRVELAGLAGWADLVGRFRFVRE